MPGVPSNKACERCKKRHVKCDETRPHCRRCTDSGVECPGYVQMRKFIDQGPSVRRRYAPYQEHVSRPSSGRNTPEVVNYQILEPGTGDDNDHPETQPRQPHSAEASNHQPSTYGPMQLDSGRSTPSNVSHDMNNALNHTNANARTELVSRRNSFQLTGAQGMPAEHGPAPQSFVQPSAQEERRFESSSQRDEQEEFQDIFSDLMTGTEHEASFLVRHYCDVLAAWFDVSDAGKFFSACVPVRAMDEESLRFAIAAISAKHLGKMKGLRSTSTSGIFTSPSTMESYPNEQQVDWTLKAANYYYLSVSRMSSSVSDYAAISTSDILELPISILNRWLNLQLKLAKEQPQVASEPIWRKTENLLATATILTFYKVLDEPSEKWQSSLTGVKPLFSQLIDLSERSYGDAEFPPGVTAAFWNFAKLDYLASYYNRLPTHLHPDDSALWRAAGLSDEEQESHSSETTPRMQMFPSEDIAANRLTRLMNKLTNYLAASKKSQIDHFIGHSSPEIPTPSRSVRSSPEPQPTTATWLDISLQFQYWVERVPETFRPCLRLDRPKPPTTNIPISFPEIFYSLPSCAAAMQQYHFGRLALSLNRPADDISGLSTAFDRLQGYRELTKEVDHRCREICGIALGRPQSGARVQMITMLYAVGQCMEKPEERQIVIDLLRGIEADLGWSTASQVQRLQR
ncbi:hypothetical protein BDV18DRAFT_96211 [Aspergillus unguis]